MDLNDKQVTACKQHLGAARWAYNWGLRRMQEHYQKTGKSLSAIDLHKELVHLKKSKAPWLYESSKCAPQEALRNLERAIKNFFMRCALKKAGRRQGPLGYPRFKSKKRGLGTCTLRGSIKIHEQVIQLPKLGKLRLKERDYLPVGAKVLNATISERGGRWYVSVQVKEEIEAPANTGPVVGVDLGIKNLATVSDGEVVANPRHLQASLRKLKRLQRAVSRKQKGSANRRKAARRLGRLHRHVANQRTDTLHKLTSHLTKTKSVVVIEDLHVEGMLKNHHLARAISDVGWGEFRRQLEYKAKWHGSKVMVADRWFASSKTCSSCGWVDENLTLANRMFICQACHLVIDRDLNAARNLAKLAGSSPDRINACGEGARLQRGAVLNEAGTKQQAALSEMLA